MIRAVKSQQRPFIRWMNMNQTYNWMTILSKTFGKVKVRLQVMMYPQICGRLVAQTNILRSLQNGLTGLAADASQLTIKFVYDGRLKDFKDHLVQFQSDG